LTPVERMRNMKLEIVLIMMAPPASEG
jgi:hypothetical protein